MSTKALLIVCIVSLISLSKPNSLHSQIRVYPDSVLIIQDINGNVGYVFPHRIAVEYRNLKKELYPAAVELIKGLKDQVTQQDTLISNLNQQTRSQLLQMKNKDEQLRLMRDALDTSESVLKKKALQMKLYRFSTYLLASAVVALTIAYTTK